jgi:hypothetical protein
VRNGTIWDDEDQRVYLVAPATTSVADVRDLMIKRAREEWGMVVTIESTPSLDFVREPEGDEDEERMFVVGHEDPRAIPVWVAWFDAPIHGLSAADTGSGR